MKWLSLMLTASAVVAPVAPATIAQNHTLESNSVLIHPMEPLVGDPTQSLQADAAHLTLLAKQAAEAETKLQNAARIEKVIAKLKTTVGKTWYAFSGATPSGWDCSGLVMWTYEQLDVTLEHRASEQHLAGTTVKEPLPGDIISFSRDGGKSYYHTAIYIGNGKLIQALRPGTVTRIDPVDSRLFAGDKITFTRILKL